MVGSLFFLALPWLNPFSHSPTASVTPLLLSWACAAALLLLGYRQQPRASWSCMGPMTGLALWLAGAAIWSGGEPPGAEVLALGMSLLVILGCAWQYAQAARSDAITLARALLLAGLASVLMGWLQYMDATDALTPWVSRSHLGEAFGNLRQRNLFASLTSIALCALLWLARADPWFSSPARVAGPAVLLVIGNAMSLSRTGLFELLLILGLAGVWGLYRERAVRWTLAPVLPAYGVAALGLPALFSAAGNLGIFTRLTEGAPLCSSRTTLWSNVLELIGQKPWLGWGWGRLDYAHFMTLYDGPRFCDILDNAHNLPLHLAVELGVPVAALVCGIGLWAVWRAQPWRETDPVRQMAWGILAAIVLHSLLEYPLWYGPFQIAFGISLGLVCSPRPAGATRHATRAHGLQATPALRSLGSVVLAVLMLAGVAAAAWDYHRIRQIYLPPEERAADYRENALSKARDAWLFRDQIRFAELTMSGLTQDNAEWTLATATALLPFSPEPRVIEKVIESAVMLGKDDIALLYLVRYRAAFPKEHAQWSEALAPAPVLAGPGG